MNAISEWISNCFKMGRSKELTFAHLSICTLPNWELRSIEACTNAQHQLHNAVCKCCGHKTRYFKYQIHRTKLFTSLSRPCGQPLLLCLFSGPGLHVEYIFLIYVSSSCYPSSPVHACAIVLVFVCNRSHSDGLARLGELSVVCFCAEKEHNIF